jgi:hypothetical protein
LIIGIAAILFAGLFMYIMKNKKAVKPEEAQTDAAIPPQPPQPTPPPGE